jgi:hypothetical protein
MFFNKRQIFVNPHLNWQNSQDRRCDAENPPLLMRILILSKLSSCVFVLGKQHLIRTFYLWRLECTGFQIDQFFNLTAILRNVALQIIYRTGATVVISVTLVYTIYSRLLLSARFIDRHSK